jgi:hypothetical protein
VERPELVDGQRAVEFGGIGAVRHPPST